MKNPSKKNKEYKLMFLKALRFMRDIASYSPYYFLIAIVDSILKGMLPFLNIIFTKELIDELVENQRINYLFLYALLIAGNNLIFGVVATFLGKKLQIFKLKIINIIEKNTSNHVMNLYYEFLEDPNVLDLKERALTPIVTQDIINRMFNSIFGILKSLVSFLGVVIIIVQFSPAITAILLLILAVNVILNKRVQQTEFRFHEVSAPYNRKLKYFTGFSTDFSFSKDIRIYEAQKLISNRITKYHQETYKNFSVVHEAYGFFTGLVGINTQLQVVLIYALTIYKLFMKVITIGEFSMYISAARSFSDAMSSMMYAFVEFFQMSKYIINYYQFMDLPVQNKAGVKKLEDLCDYSVEFRNVSFRYPGSEKYVLKNISFKIQKGENIALVGKNGAGKSTLLKLLCRFYQPDEGQILIGGIDINDIDYTNYSKLISVIFQDFKLFAFSLKENIAFDANGVGSYDINQIIEEVGIKKMVEMLPDGLETMIYKIFDSDGIELSGGQAQKVAIARACFKQTPIIIMDEPTAALDPYAESEIFEKLNELAKGRTGILISHRLSSCQFCDRIVVFDDGNIYEEGTHLQLLEKEGLYCDMWNIQAKYYRTELLGEG